MHVDIRSANRPIGPTLRAHLEEQFASAFDRIESRVGSVWVYLSFPDFPGGEDVVGRVVVRMPGHDDVVVTGRHPRLTTLANRIANRAASAASRRLARKRTLRRRPRHAGRLTVAV